MSPGRERPLPKRPFRDSALVYGGMAAVGFAFLLLTGTRVVIALAAMAVFFLLATAWAWWRYWSRLKEGRR